MRVIHFTYNTSGGAGKVANQLHVLLKKNGYESAIINTEVPDAKAGLYTIPALNRIYRRIIIFFRYWIFRIYIRLKYKKRPHYNFTFNYNYRNLSVKEIIESIPFKPDLIFLHWISDFILPEHIEPLQKHYNCPVIWRYNDLAPATGGCHYTVGCERYKTGCGECPALGSRDPGDWSRSHWLNMKKNLDPLPLTVINSTKETEIAFKNSPLFHGKRQEFIRNSLDPAHYNTEGRQEARTRFNLPSDKKVIFWGATYITEPRKGFSLFLEALQELENRGNDYLIVIAGNRSINYSPILPFQSRFVGLLSTSELSQWYKAADLVAVSSLEDGGPMMIVESLLCGTPVVSFATGLGMELVITGETGYRANKADVKDLAAGLLYVLNLPPAEILALRNRCHQYAAALYGEEVEMAAYNKLFAELLKGK